LKEIFTGGNEGNGGMGEVGNQKNGFEETKAGGGIEGAERLYEFSHDRHSVAAIDRGLRANENG
jgi:hypothetical protein